MSHVPPRSRGTLSRQADHSYFTRTLRLPAQSFIHIEALSGLVLLASTVAALVWANFDKAAYEHFINADLLEWLGISDGHDDAPGDPGHHGLSVYFVINDILMAFFFAIAASSSVDECAPWPKRGRRLRPVSRT